MNGATTANYTYNGNGQRVKKVVNGTTTIFHYDQRGQLIAESDGAGATTAEYVYLNSQPLAKIEGSNVYFYHDDLLGTPQKMTDVTGTVVWAADYKPFGEATIDPTSTITNNLRYPGQYGDAETGLNQNWWRDYNALIGKYTEADPLMTQFNQLTRKYLNSLLRPNRRPSDINRESTVKISMGTDAYAYAMNNPLKLIDPLGLFNAAPIDTPCGPLYVDSGSHFTCLCYKLNTSAEDRCKCLGDAMYDPDLTQACIDCDAKFPLSPEQACLCTCNAAGGKFCDKICKRLCK